MAGSTTPSQQQFLRWYASRPLYIFGLPAFDNSAKTSEVFPGFEVDDRGRSRYADHKRNIVHYFDETGKEITNLKSSDATEEAAWLALNHFPPYNQNMAGAMADLLNPYGPAGLGQTMTSQRPLMNSTEPPAQTWSVNYCKNADGSFNVVMMGGMNPKGSLFSPGKPELKIEFDFQSTIQFTAKHQEDGSWKYFLPDKPQIQIIGADSLLARTLLSLPAQREKLDEPLSAALLNSLNIGIELRDLFRQISQEPGLQLSDDVKSQFTAYARSHPDQATQVQALVNAVPAAKLAQATQLVDSVLSGTLPAGWPTPLGTEQRQEFKAAFEIVFHSLLSSHPSAAQALGVKYLTACQAEGSALHRLMTKGVGIFSRYSIKEERAARTHDQISETIKKYCPGAMPRVARAGRGVAEDGGSVASTAAPSVAVPSSASTAGAGSGGGGQPPSTLVFQAAAAAAEAAAAAAAAAARIDELRK